MTCRLLINLFCPMLAAAFLSIPVPIFAETLEKTQAVKETSSLLPETGEAISVTVWQSFNARLPKGWAEEAAHAKALMQALQEAIIKLAKRDDIRFVMEDAEMWPGQYGQEAVVFTLLGTPQQSLELRGIPPRLEVGVTLHFQPLAATEGLLAQLRATVRQRSHLEETAAVLQDIDASLHHFEEYMSDASGLREFSPPAMPEKGTPNEIPVTGRTNQSTLPAPSKENTDLRLESAVKRLKALRLFLAYRLSQDSPETSSAIKTSRPQEGAALNDLLRDAPDSAPILCAAARTLLGEGQLARAQVLIDRGIAAAPSYPMGYALRGALELAREKPSLAVQDISRALELSPRNPEHLYARAVAWRALEDMPAMCSDLRSACSFGWCEWYENAQQAGQCL